MQLAQFITEQRRAFISAFRSANYPVAIRGVDMLGRFLFPPATWQWDSSVGDGEEALVRTVQTEQGEHKEFWIDPSRPYRNAFKSFLYREYGVPLENIPQSLHADHMFNKALAIKHGLQYVRMALVPGLYNSGWGGRIERMLTNMLSRDNSCYRLDCFIFMKVMNITPPADYADYQARRTPIAQQLSAETGIPADQLLMAMDGMFGLWRVN
ncbi:MAG: hypothetical protein JO339_13845 [Alphaproteobacteria bacterium]|nr:hypothetical protein [Alphaproteobacteria bacterium]